MNEHVERLIDAVYSEPRPFATAEEFSRAAHDDLPYLGPEEIRAELVLATIKWACIVHRRGEVSQWLSERIERLKRRTERERVQREQRRRR